MLLYFLAFLYILFNVSIPVILGSGETAHNVYSRPLGSVGQYESRVMWYPASYAVTQIWGTRAVRGSKMVDKMAVLPFSARRTYGVHTFPWSLWGVCTR